MHGNLSEEESKEILFRNIYGYLGMADGVEPYVVPITYAVSNNTIYGHTYRGKKTDIFQRNPHVCLLVSEVDTLDTWKTVLCTGIVKELQGKEAAQAIETIVHCLSRQSQAKGANLPLQEGGISHGLHHDKSPFVYSISIKTLSGRFEQRDHNVIQSTLEMLQEL